MKRIKAKLIIGLALTSMSAYGLGYITGYSEEPQRIYIFVPAKNSETESCITDSECEEMFGPEDEQSLGDSTNA